MSGSCTVTPGKTFNGTELVDHSKLNLAANPIVQVGAEQITERELQLAGLIAKLGDRLAGLNYLLNGNFDLPFWTDGLSSPLTCNSGAKTDFSTYWWVKPAGASVEVEANTTVPLAGAFHSARLKGNTGATDVELGQDVRAWLTRSIREELTLSVYILNNTGGSFTPVLRVYTPSAVDDYTSNTLRESVNGVSQAASGSTWVLQTFTLDISAITNIANGMRLAILVPSGSLDAATKYVHFSQFKLERGDTATPYTPVLTDLYETTTPINQGGTGQTVREDAFDALAPASAVAGDVMYHNGTHWVRLAKDGALKRLRMNAGNTAPEWGDPELPASPTKGDMIFFNGSAWVKLALADGQIPVGNTAAGVVAMAVTDAGSDTDVVIVSDTRAQGSTGQTFSSGSWNTVVINTEDVDTGGIASLGSNQVTLAAATYDVEWTLFVDPAMPVATRLYDTTHSAVLVGGLTSAGSIGVLQGRGRFTLAESSVLELQFFSSAARPALAGANVASTSERFMQMKFTRV